MSVKLHIILCHLHLHPHSYQSHLSPYSSYTTLVPCMHPGQFFVVSTKQTLERGKIQKQKSCVSFLLLSTYHVRDFPRSSLPSLIKTYSVPPQTQESFRPQSIPPRSIDVVERGHLLSSRGHPLSCRNERGDGCMISVLITTYYKNHLCSLRNMII